MYVNSGMGWLGLNHVVPLEVPGSCISDVDRQRSGCGREGRLGKAVNKQLGKQAEKLVRRGRRRFCLAGQKGRRRGRARAEDLIDITVAGMS